VRGPSTYETLPGCATLVFPQNIKNQRILTRDVIIRFGHIVLMCHGFPSATILANKQNVPDHGITEHTI